MAVIKINKALHTPSLSARNCTENINSEDQGVYGVFSFLDDPTRCALRLSWPLFTLIWAREETGTCPKAIRVFYMYVYMYPKKVLKLSYSETILIFPF